MKLKSAPRLSRRTADRLLDGRGGPAELSSLLASAAAPPPGFVPADGEAEALAHFRAYAALPRRSTRRPSMFRRIAALSATTKALTVAAAAAAGTSGLALTSNGVSIPGTMPDEQNPRSGIHAPATPGEGRGSGDGSTPDGAGGPTGSVAGTKSASSGSPNPSLRGLCVAYEAKAGREAGKSLDSAAFRQLVTAAGGKENVAEYCTALLAASDQADNADKAAEKAASKAASEASRSAAKASRKAEKPQAADDGEPATTPDEATP